MSNQLVLKFDPNTIQHLGISLYSKLPSVLSELVSNSWDAGADNVAINFIDDGKQKEIVYEDDGEGMTFQELQDKYLVIGRNRRENPSEKIKKNRKVIGKKGLGKLSVFGICNVIEVISIKDGLKNHFKMDLSKIRGSKDKEYFPEIISRDEPTPDKNGTTLILKEIRRKSSFDINKIALSLSKKFLIFDKMKTSLFLNGDDETKVTNELKLLIVTDCVGAMSALLRQR